MSDIPVDKQPIIRGERVYLRAHERSDVPLFVSWLNDSVTTSFLSMRAPMSVAMEEAWFERTVREQGTDAYRFTICMLETGEPIGTIGLFAIDRDNGSAGIGISIGDRSLWGQGLGTDAMFALLDFGFGQLRLERLWLDVYDYNARARRSYEKCGFVLEGTQRNAVFKRGRFHDVHLMSILSDEWASQPRKRMWEYDTDV